MKPVYLSELTVAMALVAGNCAQAEGPETQEMRAIIAGIEFITQNSSLEYAGQELPNVIVVSENELQMRFRSSVAVGLRNEDNRSFAPVAAFYDRSANKIFLSAENSIAGPGLIHELVHFLQHVNGKDDMFNSQGVCLEAEAYDLQATWQIEQGIDLKSRPQYGFVMTLYGACNDADFSWIDSPVLRP